MEGQQIPQALADTVTLHTNVHIHCEQISTQMRNKLIKILQTRINNCGSESLTGHYMTLVGSNFTHFAGKASRAWAMISHNDRELIRRKAELLNINLWPSDMAFYSQGPLNGMVASDHADHFRAVGDGAGLRRGA